MSNEDKRTAQKLTLAQRVMMPLGKALLHSAGFQVQERTEDTKTAPQKAPFSAQKASLAETIPDKESGKLATKEFSFEQGARNVYSANAWVYACIDRIAKSVMSVPWKVQVRNSPDKPWETQEGHEGELLLEYPNPFMSGEDLMLRTTMHMYLSGNAIWGKNRVSSTVDELWPYRPDKMTPIKKKGTFIEAYQEALGGKETKNHPVEDIVHFQFPNPLDPFWGMGPLQAAYLAAETDVSAGRWQKESLARRCVRDGVLSFNRDLSLEQYRETVQALQDQFMGPANARGPIVVGHEGTFQPTSQTPVEFDFVNGRRFGREEICSVFGVPPMLVGIFDKAALANVRIARAIFWLDTVIPFLIVLAGTLNRTLAFDFASGDAKKSRGKIRFAFDLTKLEALQELLKEKAQIADILWKMGVPWDEIERRFSFGITPFEGSDIGWIPSTIKPVQFILQEGPGGGADGTIGTGDSPEDGTDDNTDETTTTTDDTDSDEE